MHPVDHASRVGDVAAGHLDALAGDGIPITSFGIADIHAEHKRLEDLGVRFTQAPVDMGPVITAVFDETCGNLVQIAERRGP